MDASIDTINSEHFCYYKRCLENNLPPALSAPHVDHVNVETDEDIDDDFDIFLMEIWNLKIYNHLYIFSKILMLS